jgi:hypothetical protein
VFSGPFANIQPAAVEIHATYSGFSEEVSAIEIALTAKPKASF